ncbi:DUF4124 domain-containing protein [Telluria aromaticivorans]|uniref:DUF4124 domain-containing protein n=1 Tax=Telluria aromaticivorans TaxID=2725995 RepID=A0A7Y2JW42_9BURK|nr:DUF4124 domain-containing protein [Telluria aromaticivorans]NNG22127.1 DUF4124 domain-containing protein [Telluria aromaticivorans]
MKRHLCLSLIIAATTLTTPGAFAGSDIVKCVDGAGHVTLTDQACDANTATVQLASTVVREEAPRAETHPLAVEHVALPQPPVQRRHLAPRVKAKPMMRDVATLREARAHFLMLDSVPRQRLATLD